MYMEKWYYLISFSFCQHSNSNINDMKRKEQQQSEQKQNHSTVYSHGINKISQFIK